MANIRETIARAEDLDPALAKQLKEWVAKHSYGLVFEQDLPENIRLYSARCGAGDKVNILPARGKRETEANSVIWKIRSIQHDEAALENGTEVKSVPLEDCVRVVNYRDIVYPTLQEIDRIERGSVNDPYQVIINAENYHALELLSYCYPGNVDCIYIDPPYNTGNQDWKYNNDYVSSEDAYRHSKWLSFMERRLKLAKKLLNPEDSVLICAIGEDEVHRLGLLLESVFPVARIQMVSLNTNAHDTSTARFMRAGEYLFFVMLGAASPLKLEQSTDFKLARSIKKDPYKFLQRAGSNEYRSDRPNEFYPIFVKGGKIVGIGAPLPPGKHVQDIEIPQDCRVILPLFKDGREGCWQVEGAKLRHLIEEHRVWLTNSGSIKYIPQVTWDEFEEIYGPIKEFSLDPEDGHILVDKGCEPKLKFIPADIWNVRLHNASDYGTKLLRKFLGNKRFSYPKSLYAVEDAIRFFIADKPKALVLDFFAGSGTTLHAVNLLNADDGGQRRCICVTNNEVSLKEADELVDSGIRQGDPEWEALGIANYVTWPRTKCSIEGKDVNGKPVQGDYHSYHSENDNHGFPMAEGFKANAIFFELKYESMWNILLDRAFTEIAPILWLRAGSRGPIIDKRVKSYSLTDYYGVLFDFSYVSKFCDEVRKRELVKTVFVVTDDQKKYSNICRRLRNVDVRRLYSTYLETFRIYGEGGLD